MSKITFKYPNDGLTIKAVQVYHQEALFFGLIFPVIEQQAKRESHTEELIGNIGENWAKQELAVLGFVSTYHMWERQLKELFLEQKALSNIDVPPFTKKFDNFVQYGKSILLDFFEVSVLEEYWLELDRSRMVVNAFKHRSGNAFDTAMKDHPNFFFTPKDDRHLPMISVSLEQLRALIKTVALFWEELPKKIDYAHKII